MTTTISTGWRSSAEVAYTRMHPDVPLLLAANATPEDNLPAVEPDLEDVYFSTMAGHIGWRGEQPAPTVAS